MAGRHFDPHQYLACITDRLFAPSKLGSSTHVEISRESHANAPLSDFNGNPSSLAGQRRKIRPDAFKGKKHDQKFCSPDFWHGGDWGDTYIVRTCFGRIPAIEAMRNEVAAWEETRNSQSRAVD